MSSDAPQIEGLTFVRKLGRGGYADVYLYQQIEPERLVAVKVIRDATSSDSVRRRFKAEANAMAKFHGYRNIASILQTGTTSDNRLYLVMPYYPGGNIADGKRRSVSEVLQIGINIGTALEVAHRKALFHRDVKPPNILYDDEHRTYVLADFGIAAGHGPHDGDDGVSIPWAPPEILYDHAPAGVQSDVYSLAATLWTLLVGRSPFEVQGGDNSDAQMMLRIRTLPPPASGRSDVPDALERLLRQAMAKAPEQRPQSAAEVIRWLQRIEHDQRLGPTHSEAIETPITQSASSQTAKREIPTLHQPSQIGGSNPTRRTSTPVVVPAQPVRLQPVRHSGDPTPATRPGGPRVAAATVQRASAVVESTPPAAAPPRNRRIPVIAAAVAVLIGAMTVVGVLFWSGKGPPAAPESTTPESTPILQDPAPPGMVEIVAERVDDDTVRFRWTYPEPRPGDIFKYLRDKKERGVVSEPTKTFDDAEGRTCLSVIVQRVDGSDPTTEWPKAKCSDDE